MQQEHPQIKYAYDAVGNRLSRTSTVAQISNQAPTYDNNDRLNSDTYDANGSTLTSNGKTYNYDFENRLTSTSDGVTVVYDGDGNRVSKTAAGVTTFYLVDTNNLTGYAQVVEELRSGVGVVKSYTYGHDLISQRQGSAVSFYSYDGHGSVRQLTNASGSVTDTYAYDAFGTLIERTGTTDNNYLYAGEQWDADLAFYYNRARYLNVETGRFISQDTYEGSRFEPLTLHKYLYANADAVNRIDPSGYVSSQDFTIAFATSVNVLASISTALLTALQRSGGAINTTIRGFEFIRQIATSTFARSGNYLLAFEEKVVNSNARVDLIIQRVRGAEISNVLVEGKGVPWGIINNPSAWSSYLDQLSRQASAFANSTQTVNGVTFTQRVIVFSSRPPAEQAAQIQNAIGRHYNQIFWSVQEYIRWLE